MRLLQFFRQPLLFNQRVQLRKTIKDRLRKVLKDRRRARRYRAQHAVSFIIGIALGGGDETKIITGRTHDLSETGLSLRLPWLDEQLQELAIPGASARLVLALPARTVQMQAQVMHSRPLYSGDVERGHLLGCRITGMSAEDESLYRQYLNSDD